MSFQKSWIDKETSWDASPAISVHINAFCCGSLRYEGSEHCRGNEEVFLTCQKRDNFIN